MLKKHNKHGPMKWFAGMLAAAGLLLALPAAQPVYADGNTESYDPTAIQTAYNGFSAVSDIKVNNVSVRDYGYYQIAFNANGGSGSIAAMTLSYDQSQTLPKNIFTRDGYTWTGWNTKADGTGTAYKDEQSVKNLTDKSDSTITLYAQWKAESQTAKFKLNYNDGTASVPEFDGSSDTITKNTDQKLGTLPKLKDRSGYDFDGWYTDAVSGTKISSDTTMPAGGATYYAHWTIRTYQIKYATDYGTIGGAHPKTYTVEDRVTIPMPEGSSTGVFKDASGADWYFTGWHINGVSGFPATAVLEKGTTGNKFAQATFDANGFRITCEDWTADIGDGSVYDGHALPEDKHENETYEGMGNQNTRNRVTKLNSNAHVFHYAKLGESVSGADWGDDTTFDKYYIWYQYSGATHETVTGNTTVYRYFNHSVFVSVNDMKSYQIALKSGTMKFYNIFQYTGVQRDSYDGYRYSDDNVELHMKSGTPVKTFSVDATWDPWAPAGVVFDDIVVDSKYSLYMGPDGKGITVNKPWIDHGNGRFTVDMNSAGTGMLPDTTNLIVTDGSVDSTLDFFNNLFLFDYEKDSDIWTGRNITSTEYSLRQYVDSMTLIVQEPGQQPVEKDLSWYMGSGQYLKRGTKITLKDVKMKPGYAWGPMMSYGRYNYPRIHNIGDTITIDTPSGGVGKEFLIYRNAYTVRYEANGGTGKEMSTTLAPKSGTKAKASANTYTNKYGRFLGWSTSPDGSSEKDVMFHAGDELPYDLGDVSETVTLYAVWDWTGDDDAQSAKKNNVSSQSEQTTFVWDD